MLALLDTNIIIHRETASIQRQDIGILYRWLEKSGYTKTIHPITIWEIKKNPNQSTVQSFLAKMQSYEQIRNESPEAKEIEQLKEKYDHNDNDRLDSTLLNEVFVGRVDIFITEDKKIHRKAELLGIGNKVFNIDGFLEKIYSEHPDLVDYKVLNVRKLEFAKINLADSFFDSLKEDYPGFDRWFLRKADEIAYLTINKDNNRLLSFLYLKSEDERENYSNIQPPLPPKRRLKVGTFKVVSNGFRLGERFMKIVFDNALQQNVQEIYVTIFDHREEQRRLISLLEEWGFVFWGMKNSERVYIRNFNPAVSDTDFRKTYPYIALNGDKYLVPIYPDYHTDLLPDSILRTESPLNFIEDFPHRNAIQKVYVSRAFLPHPKHGDLLIFYRTGGVHLSVVTTIGLVDEVVKEFKDVNDFVSQCRKRTVYNEQQLRNMWEYNKRNPPFIIRFLYVYSFPHRINMRRLIELGILAGVNDAPRGFKSITNEQVQIILQETKSETRFIVDKT